jgi:acyl-CoA synthetase (AMP-forming)/AMP-acid ligase II
LNIAHLLRKAVRAAPRATALSHGVARHATYAEFGNRVAALAAGLRRWHGLQCGDRVAVIMANTPEYMEAMFAIWHAGLVAVPVNAKLHQREFEYVLDHSGARLCFTTPKLTESVASLIATVGSLETVLPVDEADYAKLLSHDAIDMVDVLPEDPAWLFYTSGTTGRPKGAILSHRNLLMMTLSYLADLDTIATGDTIIHAAPMSHGSGLYGLPHVARAANQVTPESGGFIPAEIVDLINAHSGVTFFFAPTMIVRLMNDPALRNAEMTNLKSLIYGGGPMYAADTVKALEVFGPRLIQIYGQGESPMTITYLSREAHLEQDHPRYMARLASVGIERTDVAVRVVDDDDRPLPTGAVGEVVVRGDVVMKGYWQNPDATAETLRNGWLHTGDMGSFDDDGYLSLMDRSKDVIISGGTNIYPREVEEALLEHPGVLEVSVVGRPNPEWGEDVVAFVVPRPGQTIHEAELDQTCLDRIARFKRPKAYFVTDALPKNAYGKILKTELRQRLASTSGT